MSVHLEAMAIAAVVGAVGGIGVPSLIRTLPEPPEPEPLEPQPEGEEEDEAHRARREEGPKETYVDIARRPGLLLGSILASAVGAGLIGLVVGLHLSLVALVPLVPLGVALAVIDLRTRLLPSMLVLPAIAAVVVLGAVSWPVTGDSSALVRGLIGLVIARSVFWVLWAIHSAGMGFGDVRLAALLGFVTAYLGWAEFAVGMYSGFLLFGLPGLAVAIAKRDRKLLKKGYPFGPFMLLGALLGVVAGGPLLDALLG